MFNPPARRGTRLAAHAGPGSDAGARTMTQFPLFLFAALALLATPGPTNTLLLVAGATAGWKRALPCVLAELAGYATAIAILVAGVGPLVKAAPALGGALRIAAALWLLFVATKLWTSAPGVAPTIARPVTPARVYVTTLVNPKALVFAFAILPHLFDGRLREAIPYLASLAPLIAATGAGWALAGAIAGVAQANFRTTSFVPRLGAVAQLCFASLLILSVVWK